MFMLLLMGHGLYIFKNQKKISFYECCYNKIRPKDYILMNFMDVVMPSLWCLGYFHHYPQVNRKIHNLPQLSYG